MAERDEPSLDPTDAAERRTLLLVLGINFTQFVVAGVVGLIASSTGLGFRPFRICSWRPIACSLS
jgi:hypothetical protein